MKSDEMQMGKFPQAVVPRGSQCRQAHVDWREGRLIETLHLSRQKSSCLDRKTGAQFDQQFGSGSLHDSVGRLIEDRLLSTGQVVLRQPADLFKEMRTGRIVKKPRLQPGWLIQQGGQDIVSSRLRRLPFRVPDSTFDLAPVGCVKAILISSTQ